VTQSSELETNEWLTIDLVLSIRQNANALTLGGGSSGCRDELIPLSSRRRSSCCRSTSLRISLSN